MNFLAFQMIDNILFGLFQFFKSLGLLGAFLSMFLENIGIPLPTEIGYLISQNLLNTEKYGYFFIIFILTLGHLSGALVSYQIGLWGDVLVTKKLKKSAKIQEVRVKLEKWYQRWGNLTIFFSRFWGYVRPWSSFVAGFAKVKLWPFLLWTALGSLIFNILALYFSSLILLIWRKYAPFHFYLTLILFFSFFGLVFYSLLKNWLGRRGKSS